MTTEEKLQQLMREGEEMGLKNPSRSMQRLEQPMMTEQPSDHPVGIIDTKYQPMQHPQKLDEEDDDRLLEVNYHGPNITVNKVTKPPQIMSEAGE